MLEKNGFLFPPAVPTAGSAALVARINGNLIKSIYVYSRLE